MFIKVATRVFQFRMRVSDRYMSFVMRTGRDASYGFRAVRQAPVNAASGE